MFLHPSHVIRTPPVAEYEAGRCVIAAFVGLYAPEALTPPGSVFSHDFKGFERFTKLVTSSILG
jgi:hypothetical protein